MKLGLFEWAMTKIFPYVDIHRDGTEDIYLRRFFIYPRDKDFNKNVGKPRIYLHKFYRGDEDLHLHNHPWSFTSLILTRGYWEETSDEAADIPGGTNRCYTIGPNYEKRSQKWFKPFSVLHRPAIWAHRVILDRPDKPVWTIVKTGVKERSWGFLIEGIQCNWRNYKDGRCVRWCETEGS